MMSLPVWLSGPMFLLGGLCLWSHVLMGGSPGEVSIRVLSVQETPSNGEERAVRIL